MQGRVREAVEKIYQREKELTAETLQEELDMGPKEVQRLLFASIAYVSPRSRQWGRFGRDVMKCTNFVII